MYFDGKATSRYLRRRHKLYKALNNHIHGLSQLPANQPDPQSPKPYSLIEAKEALKAVLTVFLEQNLDIFQTLEILKLHQTVIVHFTREIIHAIILALKFHSGHKLSYIVYRFCRQYPPIFKRVFIALEEMLIKNHQNDFFTLEVCVFYTDLFFYGFFFTAKTYLEIILPQIQPFAVDFIIKFPPVHEWDVFMSKRHVFKIKSSLENWMNDLIRNTKLQFEKLQNLADQTQSQIINQKVEIRTKQIKEPLKNPQPQNLSKQYAALYQEYETVRGKLEYLEKDEGIHVSRSLQKVISQCDYYEPLFKLPDLLHELYKKRQVPNMQIKRIKKSQMASIFDDEAFLTQLRMCNSIQKAVDLSAYFIANLSTESNGEELIEYIIDECHYESNLDLIMKIVAEISCEYPEMAQKLNKKAHKISSQIKMNRKYLNLLCQGIKYGLIDSVIVLDYVEKRILTEHTQMSVFEIVRESCSILQLLGQSVYHESLKTNIMINKLFEMIELKIKEKKMGIEFSFNLKCLKNYLRKANYQSELTKNQDEDMENETLSELTDEFTLQEHFELILKRIKEILNKKGNNKTEESYNRRRVANYIIVSISKKSNFLQVFYQASLVKEINCKQIKEEIVEKCTEKIQSQIERNIQEGLKWSRFLGELYNYQIINRKRLTEILEFKLLFCGELCSQNYFERMVKCVVECLVISKSYLIESEIVKDTNHHIANFLIKLKLSALKYLSVKQLNKGVFDNIMTEQELSQILGYFHPCLVDRFRTVEEIHIWTQKVRFSSSKDTLLSVNLYKMLDFYTKCNKVEEFDPTLLDGGIKQKLINPTQELKPQTSQSNQPNNKGKKITYKQKDQIKYVQKQQIIVKQVAKQVPKETMKPSLSKVQQIQRQIEEINQNFRNQEKQQLGEQQKQMIKQEEENLEKTLKEMMGITPQIEINEKFPSLNQVLKTKKQKEPSETQAVEQSIQQNSFKKIIKNSQGKKIKIIARKMRSQQQHL